MLNYFSQFHGSPSTTKRKNPRDYFETVVQLDIGGIINADIAEHLSNGTLKKTNTSTPKLEQNRKRFLPVMPRLSRISLEPWPSATNLEESTLSYDDVKLNSDVPLQHSLSVQKPPPYISITRQPTEDDEDSMIEKGFINSAFSQENHDELFNSDNSFEMSEPLSLSKINLSKSVASRRQSSSSTAKRRKIIRWRRAFHNATAQVRRKTINSLPLEKKIIFQTRENYLDVVGGNTDISLSELSKKSNCEHFNSSICQSNIANNIV